jgi:hypothetical protein
MGDDINSSSPFVVWNIINPPRPAYYFPVNSVEEGAEMISHLIEAQLVTDAIQANVFGLMHQEDGEWTEWYDEQTGDDVMALIKT